MSNSPHNFDQHVAARQLSPNSPEYYEAELAWNSAVARMAELVVAAYRSGLRDWHLTLHERSYST